MSSYPAPTLHNGLLNTVFNSTDFTTTSNLNSTVVNGPLNINSLATCNAGLKVNGSINTTVSTNTVNASVSGQITLPLTTVITNTNDVVDTTNNQTISGTKTFNSTITGSVSGNAGTVTDGVYLSTAQTITGVKTFNSTITGSVSGNAGTVTDGVYLSTAQTITGLKTFSNGLQIQTTVAVTTGATPTIICSNYSFASFTLTLSANVTGFTFSNPRAGGQYVIFVTGGGSAFTISNSLSGTPVIKTNYATAVSVTATTGRAVITAYYDGTNIYINTTAYA